MSRLTFRKAGHATAGGPARHRPGRKSSFEMLEARLALALNPLPIAPFSTLPNGMPILSSLPAAPAAIYLDFDGGTYHGTEPRPAYSDDADGTTFNTAEQEVIHKAWREASIYFAMFNVNVTTIRPNKPMAWVLIGASGDGGQSYINVFPNSRPETVVGQEASKTRVSVFAHEIGHNFGLEHTSEYNLQGEETQHYRGEFSPLHGPLMGADWSGVIHSWSWWHNASGANSLQDDMAIIADDLNNYGGDGYRTDDHGNSVAAATPLESVGPTQAAVGVIERLSDVDAFSFTSDGGRYSIVAGRDGPSSVDLKLAIYDDQGNLLALEDGDPRVQPYTMVNDHHLTLDLPAGTYYALLSSHGDYADQGQYVLRVDPLPDGWVSEAVGLPGLAGYASYDADAGKFTVAGSGADIWGTQDNFQFLYQKLTGSGEITVRVDSMDDTAPWAKAGVMIRESLADNAREAYLVATPRNGLQWSARTSRGGTTSSYTPNTGTSFTPVWLRLVRTGSVMRAYRSTDGESWTLFGSPIAVSMGATVYVGMVNSAVNNQRLNTATFSGVALIGELNTEPAANSLPAPADLAVTDATYNSVTLAWTGMPLIGDLNDDSLVNTIDVDLVRANLGVVDASAGDANGDGVVDLADYNLVKNNIGAAFSYVVESSADGVNFTVVATLGSNVSTYTHTGLAGAQTYFYRVRTTDAFGQSEPSARVFGLTRPGAVSNLRVISYSTSQLVIDWTDASGENLYRVERSPNGVDGWVARSTLVRNRPSYNDVGLAPNTRYYYRISTVGPGGVTAISVVASGMTKASSSLLLNAQPLVAARSPFLAEGPSERPKAFGPPGRAAVAGEPARPSWRAPGRDLLQSNDSRAALHDGALADFGARLIPASDMQPPSGDNAGNFGALDSALAQWVGGEAA